jgi:methionine sulfoxide reductase catalytic subunit
MAHVILRPDWHIPERDVTPEAVHTNRRNFLRMMGMAGAGWALSGGLPAHGQSTPLFSNVTRNPDFTLPEGAALTDEKLVTTFNNFYEFSTVKDRVHKLVDKFKTDPWHIEVTGLCEKPFVGDVRELISGIEQEERVYRFRCRWWYLGQDFLWPV